MSAANPPPPGTAPARVPPVKRFLWGLGGVTDTMMFQGVNGLVDQIYNIGMHISPVAISIARGVPRFVDLLIDPLIGHLSDNTRSRWGRRRPWMFAGLVLGVLISILMWHVPQGDILAPSYVIGMMILFFTLAYSFFVIPYTAQGYELSTDYDERTHIFKWRQYAAAATGFLTPWLPALCIAIDQRVLGPDAKVTGAAHGIHWVSLGIGVILILSALGPLLACKESEGLHHQEEKVNLLDSFRFTFRNTAFWPLVGGNFFMKFCGSLTGIFFYYLMYYHMSGNDGAKGAAQWGVFCNAINIATFVAMYPVVGLVVRIGKKPAILGLMLLSALAYASVWFTVRPDYTPGVAGVGESIKHALTIANPGTFGVISNGWNGFIAIGATMWPALVTAAAIGIFCNSMPVIINSMLADVCDVDELACGKSRQAFYGATFVTTDKIAMGIAMLLQGFLLQASGFITSTDNAFVIQGEGTIHYWKVALLLTQPVGFLLGFACILLYPITRAKAAETRRLLDARKAITNPTP